MTRKNTFSFDNIGNWSKLFKKLPKRQQQAVYMTLACTLVFLIVAISSTILIFGEDDKQPDSSGVIDPTNSNVDSGYNKDEDSIDVDKYAAVVLPQSADAGQKYLDDTLFIGDSNTVRLHDVYNLVPLKNYMGMVGMTIQGAVSAQCVFFENDVTVYTIPKAIAKVQPRRIVMCFGTNNADGNTSVDAFIKHYKAAVKEIQSAYEYADLIVLAIPPCGLERAYPNVSQKTIDEFNKALVSMCEDLGLKFLNMAEDLKDPATGYIKTSYISADGLHLNDAGDKAWLNYVRTHAYETEDKRPPLKDIPTRQEPPAPVAGTPVPATCTENGYTPYTLWNGQVDKRDMVLALGHDENYTKTGLCGRCATKNPDYKAPASSSSSSAPHTTHTWSTEYTVTKAATCVEDGTQAHKCTFAGCTVMDTPVVIAKTGKHVYENGKCKVCGAAETPSHMHDTSGTVTSGTTATCTTAGTEKVACSANDGHFTERPTAMLPHAWAWIVDRAPTVDAEGLQHEQCNICSARQNENTVIPKLQPPASSSIVIPPAA